MAPSPSPSALVRRVTATPDPPPTGIPNPVHSEAGASAAGYRGALVAGVRTYGLVADVLSEAAGPTWRDTGWADVTLRRPLFAGEELTITVTPAGDGWSLRAEVLAADPADGADPSDGAAPARLILDGEAGLGPAPWLADLDPPAPAPGEDPPHVRPTYDLDTAPVGRPLRPLAAYVTAEAARRLATEELGVERTDLPEGRIHPWFLAARMAPLTRHNFTYGPTIHVRTQIQHLAPAHAEDQIVIGARIIDVHEAKAHWYQVLDGVLSDGRGGEVARLRHHTIFRPRGTELPEPLVGGLAVGP
jgi:acyl dehydratase